MNENNTGSSAVGNVAAPNTGVQRELTYGEKAVGLTFNPSNNAEVDVVKKLYADIIDLMSNRIQALGASPEHSEHVRLAKIAITEAQAAQMWAVKAITWQF